MRNCMADLEWKVGAAKVNITPPVGGPMVGFGARGDSPSVEIADELYAKALVFDNGLCRVALVTMDLIRPPLYERTKARIREQTGIAPECVLLNASHTHYGPKNEASEEDKLSLVEKIGSAVALAARRLEPAFVRVGRGRVDLGINRRFDGKKNEPHDQPWKPFRNGSADPDVHVLAVYRRKNVNAPPLAVLMMYACHPTSMSSVDYAISPEYPGAAQAFVEDTYGRETVALFAQGCGGDIKLRVTGLNGYFRGVTVEQNRRYGRLLGAEVVKVVESLALDHPNPVANAELRFERETFDGLQQCGLDRWPPSIETAKALRGALKKIHDAQGGASKAGWAAPLQNWLESALKVAQETGAAPATHELDRLCADAPSNDNVLGWVERIKGTLEDGLARWPLSVEEVAQTCAHLEKIQAATKGTPLEGWSRELLLHFRAALHWKGPLGGAFRVVELPREPAPSTDELDQIIAEKKRAPYVVQWAQRIKTALAEGKAPVTSTPLPLQVLGLGSEIAMVGIGGEVFHEYSRRIQALYPGKKVIVLGYSNATPCYIPVSDQLQYGGYEVLRSHLWGLNSGPFTDQVEPLIVGNVREMIAEVQGWQAKQE